MRYEKNQQVSVCLYERMHLLMMAPININYINLYYTKVHVNAFTDNQKIYLTVKLPLLDNENKFTIFNVHTIPIYDKSINMFMYWETPNQLAVSLDKTKYFIPKDNNLICTKNQPKICNYDQIVYKWNHKSCIINLFLHQSTENCKLELISTNDPIIIKTLNDYIVSVSKPMEIFVKCQNIQLPTATVNQYIVKDIKIFKNQSDCELNGEEFVMPSKFLGQMSYKIISNKKEQINFTAQIKMLKSKMNLTNIIKKYNISIPQIQLAINNRPNTSKINLENLITDAKNLKIAKTNLMTHSIGSTLTTIIILTTISSIILLYLWKKEKCCFNKQKVTLQIGNVSNV